VLYHSALKRLEVTLVQLETTTSVLRPTSSHPNHQIRLAVMSDAIAGNKVGGEIVLFESDGRQPESLWYMLNTGLFRTFIGTDIRTVDLLWQACCTKYDWFFVSLKCPDDVPIGDEVAVDIGFAYEIGHGKSRLDEIPSDHNWIASSQVAR
jgi:hypothetical protein